MKQNKHVVSPKTKSTQLKASKRKLVAGKKRSVGENKPKPFPIVAIGASAGGIEAISKLLENLSAKNGMAYVIIQHLAPDHESILPELLERKSKMPVHQVKNGMRVEADNVFVIPPGVYMSITDGHLKLYPRIKSDGVYHSIDFFLNALAPVYKDKAIAIILSGSATDGSIGVQSIKAEGGITFAQDNSAKFRSMPLSAIDSGYVDFILSPKEMAKQLAEFPKVIYKMETPAKKNGKDNFAIVLNKIYTLLRIKYEVEFSFYKPTTILRRTRRRMVLHRITNSEDYYKLLQKDESELGLLYSDLLINVTSFFREPASYTFLVKKILPALMKNRKREDPIRIWIPACASGEETYSTAICLFEYLERKKTRFPIQIFATDLNEKAIEKARSAIYSRGLMVNVSPGRVKKYFTKYDGNYQITKSIRDVCIFATHNLLNDPPFSRMDIISCQNVMIYLENVAQQKVLETFHYALKPGGFLLLGKSETITSSKGLFAQADKHHKVYTRKPGITNTRFDPSIRAYPRQEASLNKKRERTVISEDTIDKVTENLLLSQFVPASIVVDKDLQVQRFLGTASNYLQPVSGKASLDLFKLIRNELVYDLRSLFHRAKKENKPVKKGGIFLSDNGYNKELQVELFPLRSSSEEIHYLIIFKELKNVLLTQKDSNLNEARSSKGRDHSKDKHIRSLEKELEGSKEQLKMISEDTEAAREELQSANEEVLSSNEELQSMNEELETSQEELQSTNEELVTMNEELHNRNLELKESSEYKKAIIETIHESLVILSSDLRVKTVNRGFCERFKARADDTEGRYFFELGNNQWDIPVLREQLKKVQSANIDLVNFEVSHKFPHIGLKVMVLNAQRISLGTGNDAMILLAIDDITDKKLAEKSIKESEERFKLLLQNAFDIITIFDSKGIIKYESPAIETVLGYTPEERIGKSIGSIVHPEDKDKKLYMLQEALKNPEENINIEFRLQHKDGSYRTIDAISRNMIDNPRINGIIATYRDITDRKILEQQKDEFIGIASHELKTPVTSIKAYTQILQDKFQQAKDTQSVDLLEKMNAQVDRLTNLIVDLLDFTRVEGGKLKFREEYYDLNQLVDEVVEDLQRTSKQHIIKKLDNSVQIWGDRYRTGQVITNILGNAIKYSPQSTKVNISTEMKDDKIILCVQDFGIGIKKELLNRVFEKFFRVSEPVLNTFPGLGLGLYISAEIIRRQGGSIWANSKKGKGSTFCFSLPLSKKPNEKK